MEEVYFVSGFLIPAFGFLTIIYWIKGIRYKKSKYFRGKVIYSRGTKIVDRRRGEIYETYYVSYDYKGKTMEGEVCTSEKGLEPGDDIFVYIYDPEGVHKIQSDINWRKFKFYAGASLFVIVFFLILSFLIWDLGLSMETTASQKQPFTHVLGHDYEEDQKQFDEYLKELISWK